MSRASGRCSHRSPLARCSCTMQHSVKTLNSLERDQAVAEKEAIELEYIKLLSLKGEENDIREKAVGDLADKCKYLEIDLETACVAGEAAHGQLLKVAYEKDVIILDLEKSVQKFQENIRILEEERKADYKTWSKERQELIKTMDEIEREKTKYNEMSQTLKSEIGDLHGMLDAMEHATQDAQLRHANAVEFVKEENTLLKKDLEKARKDLKLVKETILKTQKEVTELHAEAAGLRAQLQDALNDAHQYQQNSVDCMHANEQLRQSLMGAQENISELIKLRKEDEILHLQQLKSCQMDWGMEREKLLEANDRDMGDRFAKLTRQNYILKKRLKQSYQVLASITCDCNKLKEQVKAKSMLIKEDKGIAEEALAETAMPVERRCSKYGHYVERREELAVPTCYESKRKPLHLDMTHLAQRQMKLLDSLVAT